MSLNDHAVSCPFIRTPHPAPPRTSPTLHACDFLRCNLEGRHVIQHVPPTCVSNAISEIWLFFDLKVSEKREFFI